MSDAERSSSEDEAGEWPERRESTRVKYVTQVHLGSDSNFYTGFSNNVSEGGLFVATHVMPNHGSIVELEFSLPDGGPPIQVEGEVRWTCDVTASERPGIAFRFRNLKDADRQRIEAFVALRETMFLDE
jgi:uncharacterized protein (TIGR02266 family)